MPPRRIADATRFTPTVPHASAADPTSPGETPQQRVARLRAAAQKVKLDKISTFDRIVDRGRIWADRAHRVTAYGLILATVLCGGITIYAFTDMMIYNRRRKREYVSSSPTTAAAAAPAAYTPPVWLPRFIAGPLTRVAHLQFEAQKALSTQTPTTPALSPLMPAAAADPVLRDEAKQSDILAAATADVTGRPSISPSTGSVALPPVPAAERARAAAAVPGEPRPGIVAKIKTWALSGLTPPDSKYEPRLESTDEARRRADNPLDTIRGKSSAVEGNQAIEVPMQREGADDLVKGGKNAEPKGGSTGMLSSISGWWSGK